MGRDAAGIRGAHAVTGFSERARLQAGQVAAIKTVAAEWRNTPAVCGKANINPTVFAT